MSSIEKLLETGRRNRTRAKNRKHDEFSIREQQSNVHVVQNFRKSKLAERLWEANRTFNFQGVRISDSEPYT